MTEVIIKKSKNPKKKYDAILNGKKTVSFGSSQYSDFTKHKDEDRKRNYIARHKPNQDWKDHTTAGFWAKNFLWNKPTIEASVRDTNQKFPKLNIKMKYLLKFFVDNYFALQLHPTHQASQLSLSCAMLLSNLWAVILLVKKPFLNSNSKLHPQLLQ